MIYLKRLVSFIALVLASTTVWADPPPIWKSTVGHGVVFGAGIMGQVNMALGFPFPLKDGGISTFITINSDGGIALIPTLNTPVELVQQDTWKNTSFESSFSAEGTPRILAFTAGLSPSMTGEVTFFSDGSRAYITWSMMGGGSLPGLGIISVQLQLRDDGTIILGYDVEDGVDFMTLSQGIVIGISNGESVWPPGSVDFSKAGNNDFFGGTTIYQIWCRAGQESDCFQQNGTAVETAFDLDGKNIVFNPTSDLAYQVSNKVKTAGDPGESCVVKKPGDGGSGDGSSGGGGSGGGGGSFDLALLLALGILASARTIIN